MVFWKRQRPGYGDDFDARHLDLVPAGSTLFHHPEGWRAARPGKPDLIIRHDGSSYELTPKGTIGAGAGEDAPRYH